MSFSPKFFSSSKNYLSPISDHILYKQDNPPFERTFIGETGPSSTMRDVLLMKCKSAIEELHQEIEELQRSKALLEERNSKLDKEVIEKDNLLKQERYFKERLEEEISEMKGNFVSINEKAAYLEDKLRYFQENEGKFEDLRRNFQMLCETNEDLKERLEDQIKETTRREGLEKEWEDTLGNVNQNIGDLNIENDSLKVEKEELLKKVDYLERNLEEAEVMRGSLDKQLELIEKLRFEIQNIQNSLLEKSEEVNTERKENERLRRLMEFGDNNLKEQLKDQEKSMKAKVNEIENLLTDRHKVEMDLFRDEMLKSLDRMEVIKKKTEEEMLKLKEEKESLKQDCRLLSEKLVQNDGELKEINEKSKKRSEDIQKESVKMQKIIEDQNEIITKLEKIIEKERNEKGQILKENEDFKEKNVFLNEKLKASHQEIENISKDVRRTFENEDEKNMVYHKRIKELESLLLEKDKNYDILSQEFIKLKASVKKQKSDVTALNFENKEIRADISKREGKMMEILKENEALKAKLQDFQEDLKERMEEFSADIKIERENRMQEQRYAHELEDKIMTLENQSKNEIGFLKTELLRKERECEKLRIKHDDLNFNLMNSQNKFKGGFSNSDELKSGLEDINEEIKFEKPEKELSDLKNQLDKLENNVYKDKVKRQMDEDKKNFSLNQRVVEATEYVTARNNPQSREFIDRFKGIINKLEDKLCKMSNELKLSDT